MKNLSEYNKNFTEHYQISLNMKIFWNAKKFTECKTPSEYENVSLNIIKFPLNRKMFLLIWKFFSEYKNMNFAPNKQPYNSAQLIYLKYNIRNLFEKLYKIDRMSTLLSETNFCKY